DEWNNILDRANEQKKENPGLTPSSLLNPAKTEQTIPGNLQGIDQKAGIYDLARANGKISETDYYSRMDQLRKEYVSNYPGFRDFIDKMFEKYTGFNSANKLLESKMRDYNAMVAGKKSDADKVVDHIVNHNMEWDPVTSRMLIAGI